MDICFTCKTNKDYVAINTLIFKLPNGTEITVDRDDTEYDIQGLDLTMVWRNCYLWAINDCNVFGFNGKYIKGNYERAEFKRLIERSTVSFMLEEDVDEDYKVEILEMSIE